MEGLSLGSSYPLLAEVIKLPLALLIGLLIGWEREYREGVPGLRVMPLVTVGATLFTLFGGVTGTTDGTFMGATFTNPGVAAGVVTGVGFLGAGVILRERGILTGLTTAAAIWVTAALGMGIGLGAYFPVGVVTIAVLLILWYFPQLSQAHHSYVYTAVAPYNEARRQEFQGRFDEKRLKILKQTLSKNGADMTCSWHVTGQPQHHQQLSLEFLNDPEVTNFMID